MFFGIRDPRSEIRDPRSGIRDGKKPGSGINIPDPQHWFLVYNSSIKRKEKASSLSFKGTAVTHRIQN
jgi:hypothetical protein